MTRCEGKCPRNVRELPRNRGITCHEGHTRRPNQGRIDLLWSTVTRNVWGVRIIFSLCDPNEGKISLTRTVISLSPHTQKQEMNWTLVLKFGNLDAGLQVGRNLRRNRSDESGHRKSSKVSQIQRKSSTSRTSPQKDKIPPP